MKEKCLERWGREIDMKAFKDMTNYELVEEIEKAEEDKKNSEEGSDRYISASLKIDAINAEIEKRK